MSNGYHRLLKRQLRKANFAPAELERMADFLDQVNRAYVGHNKDLVHLENILELSSQELFQTNLKLKSNMERLSSRLEQVVNHIEEVLFEIDMQGNWVYLNYAWESLTGYTVEESLGSHYTDYFQHIRDEDLEVLEKKLSFSDMSDTGIRQTMQVITKGGEKKWLDIMARPLPTTDLGTAGFIGTIIDITQLKETELALVKARNQEVKANKAKDEFLSTMSHELRTPLNTVISTAHLLLLEDPKQEQLEHLNALQYSAEYLLGLVNNVLDFNKIESGNLQLERSSFDLQHILDGLQGTLGTIAAEKNIKFKIKKDNAIPQVLIGDQVRLSQILNNLVSNGIKFTEKGQVLLDVEVTELLADRVELRFEVSDTGIGIPLQKQAMIFDRFTQADIHTTRKHGGTGLGLAICKRLLHLMGSDIAVDSSPGQGARFYFSLCLGLGQSKNIPSSDVHTGQSLQGLKVLLAEDFGMNIRLMERFFNHWDISYVVARDGREAVAQAEAEAFDLILMDLQMPNLDGYQAARQIRQSNKSYNQQVPIVALSASSSNDVKVKIREYGIDKHLSKPFKPKALFGHLLEAYQKAGK